MELKIIIDKDHREEVIIYTHEKSELVEKIEELVSGEEKELVGYNDDGAVLLTKSMIYAVTVENQRVFFVLEKEKLRADKRLYCYEEFFKDDFIKINQSTIVNSRKIKRFKCSIGASLLIEMENGYIDYVSRRQLKNVKERFGVK